MHLKFIVALHAQNKMTYKQQLANVKLTILMNVVC